MVDVNKFGKVGGFANELQHVRLTYDFSNDAGAIGSLDLGQAAAKMLIKSAVVHVETACTSGGSAVLTMGVTANTDAFLAAAQGAVASLVDDYVNEDAASSPLVVPKDAKFLMTIATAALTAGKVNVEIEYLLVD